METVCNIYDGVLRRNDGQNAPTLREWLFPHPYAWLLMLMVIMADAIGFQVSHMRLTGASKFLKEIDLEAIALLLAFLIAPAAFHGRRMIVAVVSAFVFYLIFSKAGLLLSYLGVGLGLPLADPLLAKIDSMLGFDWLAYVSFVNDSPRIATLLGKTYGAFGAALGLTVLYLIATGRLERLRHFFLLFAITGMITTICGGLLPATSGFHYYHPPADLISNLPKSAGRSFISHVLALHSGEMTAVDPGNLKGIVAIPSFHTIMALMVAWVLRGTWAFPAGLAYCLLTIASTPVFGGHFFTDMIAGALVFALAVTFLNKTMNAAAGAGNLT